MSNEHKRRFRIGRTLPPAAAPIELRDIVCGLRGWFRGERAVREMEESFRSFFGVRHCFAVSSGTAALTLILAALKEKRPRRTEVLIPAYTCYSVPSAIVRAGLKVALCDIDPKTLDFDYGELKRKLENPRLLAVVPTHLFGLPADVPRLREMLRDRETTIIEDAAQAMGGQFGGRKLGTLGDVGFFSLGRGKALSTVEGGIILTNCDEIAAKIAREQRRLYEYGALEMGSLVLYALVLTVFLRPSLFWLPSSLPFLNLGKTVFDPTFRMRRMSGFQAGLALHWREKLEALQAARRGSVRQWFGALMPAQAALLNDPPPLLRLPGRAKTAHGASRLLSGGAKKGLGVSAAYPDAVSAIPELAGDFAGEDFPAARDLARRIVTLPVHTYVNSEDRRKILGLLSQVEMQWPLSA